MPKTKILIVEDEGPIADDIKINLEAFGYDISVYGLTRIVRYQKIIDIS